MKKHNSSANYNSNKLLCISNILLISALCGCGGCALQADQANYQVQVADGYVEGVSVCVDSNFDFVCDTNSVTTDKFGKANITLNKDREGATPYVFIAKISKGASNTFANELSSKILRDNLMVAYQCPGDDSKEIQISSFTTIAAAMSNDSCNVYEDKLKRYTNELGIDIKKDFNLPNNKASIVNAMLEQRGKLPEDIELFKSYKENETNIDITINEYIQAASKVLSSKEKSNLTSKNISTAKAIAGFDGKQQDLIIEGRKYAYPGSLDWMKDNYFYWDHNLSDEANIANMKVFNDDFESKYISSTLGVNIPGRDQYIDKVTDNLYELNPNKAFDKKVVFVLGLPAAGKSTAITPLTDGIVTERSLTIDSEGQGKYVLVDADEIKKFLPEYNNGLLSEIVHKESSTIYYNLINKSLKNNANICFSTVGSHSNYLKELYQKKVKIYDDAGYKIIVVFVDVPVEIAKVRNIGRTKATGKYFPNSEIEKAGKNPGNNFCKLITDKEHNTNILKFIWADTSGSKPQILIEGSVSNKEDIKKLKDICTKKGYDYTK